MMRTKFKCASFLQLTIVCILSSVFVNGTIWRETTACYGADQICSSYKITCGQGQTIVLGDLKYGTKWAEPSCQFGVSDCSKQETKCCSYDQTDIFTDFSVGNRTTVIRNCEGHRSCTGWAPRFFNTPYSSYIWIKYACVEDKKNVINLCTNAQILSQEVFLTHPRYYVTSGTNSSVDCSCRVTPTVCGAYIDLTIADLDFHRPSTKRLNCSNAYLADSSIGKTFRCLSVDNVKPMSRFPITRTGDIVTLRGLYKEDYRDRPSYILLYYNSTSPISVECFPPGVASSLKDECSSTPTESKPSPSSTGEYSNSIGLVAHSTMTTSLTHKKVSSTMSDISPTLDTKDTSVSKEPLTSTLPAVSPTLIFPSTSASARSISSTLSSGTSESENSTSKHGYILFPSTEKSSATSKIISVLTPAGTSSQPSLSSALSASTSAERYSKYSSVSSALTHSVSSSFSRSTLLTGQETRTISRVVSTRPVSTGPESTSSTRATKTHHSVTGVITTVQATVDVSDDGDGNKGLIIGLTVGAILLVAILVAVAMMCLCIRLKRKEKVRRNYIQNTNIFYSFPEDYNTGESTESDVSYLDQPKNGTLTTNSINPGYESFEDQSASTINPLRLDDYKIKASTAQNLNTRLEDAVSEHESDQSQATDGTADMANETMDFINSTENDTDLRTQASEMKNNINGGKNVTFDASALYAKVRKEGKTKF